MRRLLIVVFVVIPAMMFIFGIGAVVAIRSNWGDPIANILVKNETDREIDYITISFTTCGIKRQLSYKSAEQNSAKGASQQVLMRLVLCGEGGHSTEVGLSDGRVFRSQGAYLEGGYKVTEHITDAGLVSESTRIFP